MFDNGRALQQELEEYLRRPENQKLLQEEQEQKMERAYKRRVQRLGVELSKCDQPTQLLLGPIWKNPTIVAILNGLLFEGTEYGATFEDRLYHPRVRMLLQRAAELHTENKDPDLKDLCEGWVHHLMSVQEEENEKKPKPALDSHSLLQYVNAASSCKSQGNKYYKEKDYQEAFKAYTSGVTMLASIKPNSRDQKIVDDLLFALYKNQAAAGLHVGELSTVLKACDKVLEMDPYDVKALYRRGMVHYRRDQAEAAKKDWVQASRLDPTNMEVKDMLRKLEDDAVKAEEVRKRMFQGVIAAKKADAEVSGPGTTPSKQLPIRVVVLSLYGTLVNITQKLTPSPLLSLLESAQVDQLRAAVDGLLAMQLTSAQEIAEAVPGATAEMKAKFVAGVEQEVRTVELLPGVLDALRALRKAGYALCLCANALTPYAEVVNTLCLQEAFDAILLSCEVGLVKPHPGMYHLVLERFRVKAEEVLWCGDNRLSDVAGPEKLGMRTVIFDPSLFSNGAAAICNYLHVDLPDS